MSKPLVIVESPAKARTIGKFLGPGFQVEASIGHVRDLPERKGDIPAATRAKKTWLVTAIADDYSPVYVLTDRGREQVKKLKALLKNAPELLLATDEDREGEAIAWHLTEALKPKVPVRRLVFHEITKTAIQRSLQNARTLDMDLVRAQEARRIVDRLFGYSLSEVVWRKVRQGLSAGRVQTPAVRLVVQRERERMAFRSGTWWDLSANFGADGGEYAGTLVEVDGTRLAQGRDFDSDTGRLKANINPPHLLDEAGALGLRDTLRGAPAKVIKVARRSFREKPTAPFTTSKLQQEGNRKLRWPAKKVMSVAQRLYENGWITYHRTDSTNLSDEAVSGARAIIQSTFGAAYLPASPRVYASKQKGAQEAHEAIRPAGAQFQSEAACRAALGDESARLYALIWNRTIASQMNDATGERVSVDTLVQGDGRSGLFRSRGKTYTFVGFRAVYVMSRTTTEEENELPPLRDDLPVKTLTVDASGHETSPPARLTEASLVQKLEELGIGRPSTYAAIIETIQSRGYVFKKGTALVPTWTAFAVTRLLEDHFGQLVEYDFTATMEQGLDQIAEGQANPTSYLSSFYQGATQSDGLVQLIAQAREQADPRAICTIELGDHEDTPVAVRVGRYGPYLEHGDSKRSVPEGMAPDELTLVRAVELLAEQPEGPRELGDGPDGLAVTLHVGRFGPYVQLGEQEKGSKQKPKRSSLLRGMEADQVDLETALKLLSLPRLVGLDDDGNEIRAFNGRYGPYIKRKADSRSIPDEQGLFTLTREQALELLAQPARRRASSTILAELGQDSEERKVLIKKGRFGPYITDGDVNVTLKKGMEPDQVKLEEALDLLTAKRAAGPSKRRKAAPKKAAPKKAAPKRTAAAKKAPARKAAAKKPAARKTPAKRASE